MQKSDFTTYPYSYYPNTMIALCAASYDTDNIESDVKALGLELAWGPGQLINWLHISYSLMYVTLNPLTGEYTVVIRGTDPLSLSSWLSEDFKIKNTEPFTDFVPTAPAGAALSEGTYNGLNDLLSIVDPTTKVNVVSFLKSVNPPVLYVTGHSLGGTLVPPMFAYLNYVLYGGGYVHNMACWSFAGLTSGNSSFATYFNSLFNPDFAWRIHNPLDIAPFFFYSQANVEAIYNYYGFPWSSLDLILRGLIDDLFKDAAGKDYTQPVGNQQLAAVFNINKKKWDDQAAYQHHATTYVGLVKQFYGT